MNPFSFIRQTLFDAVAIARSPQQGITDLYKTSLYRNAIYLLLNFVVMGATGFLFWIAAARLYSTEAVGLASATIAAMGLLGLLSTLGLDFALIRFLPNAKENSNAMINSCCTINILISTVVALIFIVGLDFWAPALMQIRNDPFFLTMFIISVGANVLFVTLQQIFVATRKASYAVIRGAIFGLFRFVPLVIMAAFFESFGIFASWAIGLLLAIAVALFIIIPRIQENYYPMLTINKDIVKGMFRFSFVNYFANLFWGAPGFILPIVVVNVLDADKTAYYYIAWAVTNILYMIPVSLSFSLFAEGSNDDNNLKRNITKSVKVLLLVLLPTVLLTVLLADKLLLLFGEDYSENSTRLLQIFAISALPLSLNNIYFSIKRVQMKMKSVVVLNLLVATITMALSCILLPRMGINGVGVAWLASQGSVALFVLRQLWRT